MIGPQIQTVRVVSSVAPSVKVSGPSMTITRNTLTRGDIVLQVVLVSILLLYKVFF